MSISALTERLRTNEVTPVTCDVTPDVTEIHYVNQRGYTGYTGYAENNEDVSESANEPTIAPTEEAPVRKLSVEHDTPHWAWLIRHPDGREHSSTFSPWATRAEVSAWYPGADIQPDTAPWATTEKQAAMEDLQ